MKYVDEYRDGDLARSMASAIAREALSERAYHIMEFCGGHTHTIWRYAITDLLPENVKLVHGPGCPVCVLPIGRLDQAIAIAERPDVILCTYGDMMRVPASAGMSLMKARASGPDIRVVYSSTDALQIARDNPDREVVLFAIGFETTTPPTAAAIKLAAAEGLHNFSVFCNNVLTPSAIRAILDSPEAATGQVRVDAFVGPGHVSTITGTKPYEYFTRNYGKPIVVAGFEPLDVVQAILMLIRQLNEGRAEVENQFSRAVDRDGNRKAQAMVAEVMEPREVFDWRGLGIIPHSALAIRDPYAEFDAERRFDTEYRPVPDHPACSCPEILRGVKEPTDCKIFGTGCTPDNPIGSCMVSPEGACSAYYRYGRLRAPGDGAR
jgi:hydrogenase expression/formation protein HypD